MSLDFKEIIDRQLPQGIEYEAIKLEDGQVLFYNPFNPNDQIEYGGRPPQAAPA